MRYFVAVAEDLHFGRAAQRLHIAQPPLSQQIRKLERELGVDLFLRARGKRVELTEAGKVLLAEGRRVLQRAERAAVAAQRAARGEIGHLRIGFAPSTATSVLPSAVRSFRLRVPSVRLELFEFRSDELAAELRSGELDVGLLRPPRDASDLVLEVICREQLVVALPEGHRLAGRELVSVVELAQEPLIIGARAGAPAWYEEIIALYRRSGISPQIIQEVSTGQAQLGLVAAGLGVALVPGSVRTLRLPGVVMVPVDAPLVQLLAAHPVGVSSPAIELFLACARTAGLHWSDEPSPGDAAVAAPTAARG